MIISSREPSEAHALQTGLGLASMAGSGLAAAVAPLAAVVVVVVLEEEEQAGGVVVLADVVRLASAGGEGDVVLSLIADSSRPLNSAATCSTRSSAGLQVLILVGPPPDVGSEENL